MPTGAGIDHLALLEDELSAMAAALSGADPTAPVAACPGWTVRDVAVHLIAVHGWALASLDSAVPPPYREDAGAVGDSAQSVAAAYEDVAQGLLGRLRELPADHACWTFNREDRTAAFWRRRQLHEVAVHRWDVAPYDLDEQAAADGVDEAVTFLVPRQVGAGRAALPAGSLRLVSPTGSWELGAGEPAQTLEASSGELLLALWGRGDTALPPAWRDARLLP